ncbi:AUGMIN subunit 5 isoform X1 [Juglans microcarpa x Juglans regia]|uniref:AUGMIN subunit 5 isoform X1 n=2 Tax=Juglans microcarpa x Juglans regia TaxID=2249226 RepID=UPI001B7D9CF0|nr:AUGMIN subunit 5 isoform X1 [Juglans microcarpa x Juglans regia]
MQSSSSSAAQPEAILEWLHKEMGYRPLGPYSASSGKSQLPSIESLRKISRGNMIPVWNFLITRVKSDKTVENIRRNITVHGGGNSSASDSGGGGGKEEGRSRGRRKEKVAVEEGLGVAETREAALQERESSAKEVERLRNILRRQRRDLRAKMLEVSREEAERKRMLDERANYRHKEVMLNAYEQQCDEAAKIFAEYHKRLHYYVNQARDAQRLNVDSSDEVFNSFSANSEKEAVYSTVKGNKSADDMILIETNRERSIRKACESLAAHMIEKIRNSFPAYEGSGIHLNPQLEAAKLGFDFDGEIPDEVRTVIASCLKSPPQLLQAITAYTLRLKTLISREIEKIDVRADAETLRYKYENNTVMDVSSPDVNSALHYQLYGNGKIGGDIPSRGTQNQLLERQKAHVQQFLATEDALNKAAEASDLIQKLVKRLHGSSDVVSSHSLGVGGATQNMSSLRQFEFEVWAKEREAAGLRASLNTLMAEVQRLNTLCAERKEAEDSLKKKWKKIEEFDARRSELETIYTALLKANMDAATFWSQQPLAAREYASGTIIPACSVIVDISNSAKDLIDKEVSAFYRSPDNSLYMLPSTPQALLESMGANGSTGPEAVAAAEKNAAILTAKAGARDLSAIPSICRVSAALQYPAGLEGSDASLASVLESLEFCLKLRGSEASVLEDLAKAINLVHIRQELVESGHALLNHSYRAQQEYERTTSYCLNLAAEQEKSVMEKWLPELKTAVLNAQKSFEDCKYVRGLLDEWWEQPASTVVDWVTVDGQNVAAWHNHVKQQLLAFYDKELL